MIYIADVQKTYALVLGVVLVLVGVLGFIPNPLVGDPASAVFGVNALQSIVHLVGGAVVAWFGYKGSAKTTNMWLGVAGVVLAVLGLLPVVKDLLSQWLNINMAITWLHLAIGVVSLGVAYGVKEGAAAA